MSVGSVWAAAFGAATALCWPAAALPLPPHPGLATAIPVLLVCDLGGCRHRFKSYRARPNWNRYWARQAGEGSPARPPAPLRIGR